MQRASEQAHSLEASLAAEERVQALERLLAAHQEAAAAASTSEQSTAGDPPAMAAPGNPHTPPPPSLRWRRTQTHATVCAAHMRTCSVICLTQGSSSVCLVGMGGGLFGFELPSKQL